MKREEVVSVIAPNLHVCGNCVSDGNMHIDGTVDGDVKTKRLVIGKCGSVKGSILADEVVVSGVVDGSIVTNKLALTETASVRADAKYQTLTIQKGAKLMGSCEYSDEALSGNVGGDTDNSGVSLPSRHTTPLLHSPDALPQENPSSEEESND